MYSQRLLLIFLTCLSFHSGTASARLLEDWSYKRLVKKADLVVIATVIASEKSSDSFTHQSWPLKFTGLNTTFKVKLVMKGKVKGKQIKVLHYKFQEQKKSVLIIDGPLFVTFRTRAITKIVEGQKTLVPRPDYLLFLKRRKDGRYEPVSGKIDPLLSVREVFDPLRYNELPA
jgi:hypothetical protein